MKENATPTELGDVCAEHLGRNVEGWILAPLVALVGAFFVVVLGHPWLIPIPMVVALAWFGVTTGWTPRRVVLREEGLEVHRHFRKPQSIKFSECCALFREWTVHTSIAGTGVSDYSIKLVDTNNRKVRLSPKSIKDAEYLFSRIERLVTYPKHQELNDRFARGEEVVFGKVALSQQGVRSGKRLVPWDRIRKVEVSPKLLVVCFHKRFRKTFGLGRLPFPWALVNLVKSQGVDVTFFEGFRPA